MDQDQHGPFAGLRSQKCTPARLRGFAPTVTGAPPTFPGRTSPDQLTAPPRLRWSDQRQTLLRLCEAPSPTNPARSRHRHSRQFRKPQVESCQANDPGCWRQTLAPPPCSPAPESNRHSPKSNTGRGKLRSAPSKTFAPHPSPLQNIQPREVRQLFRQRRLCFRQNVKRSSGPFWHLRKEIRKLPFDLDQSAD